LNPHTTSAQQVVVVTEHFSPAIGATAQLVTDLVDILSLTHNITVVTATPSCFSGRSKYSVVRLGTSSKASTNVLKKAFDGLSFLLQATVWLFKHSSSSTILLLVSNPPFIGALGVLLRLLKSSKYIYLLQDLFPRSAVLTGVLPAKGPITYFWTSLMSVVLSTSSHIIVLNENMKKRCSKDFHLPGNKITSIDNWAVECASSVSKADNPVAIKWNLTRTFTVQYSGNFGRLHDMLTILESCRLLSHKPIKFTFIGDGAKRTQILRYIEHYNLENVSLYPYQSRSDLTFSLGACDVSVISIIPGSEDTVAPSKFFGIIASGKPVLFIGNPTSDIAQLLSDYQCGLSIPPGDPAALSQAILHLSENPKRVEQLGLNAKELYRLRFSPVISAEAYSKIINNLNLYHALLMSW